MLNQAQEDKNHFIPGLFTKKFGFEQGGMEIQVNEVRQSADYRFRYLIKFAILLTIPG